jgi:chromosome segregation ATPase
MSGVMMGKALMTMHRELNPQLFGTQSHAEKIGHPMGPQQAAPGIMGKGAESAAAAQARQVPYPPIDIKAIEHQINTLKVALMQMEKRVDSIASRSEDLMRTVHGRLERFSQAIGRLDEVQTQHQQENTGKFAQIAAKVNERKVSDTKVQELVDRHNMVIRNFENRLLSLQRVVSEQEMALHNAQAALEEARAELQRRR